MTENTNTVVKVEKDSELMQSNKKLYSKPIRTEDREVVYGDGKKKVFTDSFYKVKGGTDGKEIKKSKLIEVWKGNKRIS